MKKIKYTKEQIQDYAKGLYLEIGRDKKKKYSLQMICDDIKANRNENVTKTTVMRWAKKYGWDSLFVKNIQHSIKQAEKENQIEERDILSEKGKSLKDLYKTSLILAKASAMQLGEKLKSKELTSVELLRLNKDHTDVIMKLNDIIDPDKANKNSTNINITVANNIDKDKLDDLEEL